MVLGLWPRVILGFVFWIFSCDYLCAMGSCLHFSIDVHLQSVCFSWLSEQEGETPASVFVCVCKPVCVCVCGEHWGGCCFHASHPDALSAHCSFSFGSTMRTYLRVCVCLCVVRHSRCPLPHHQQWQGAMVHTHTHFLSLSKDSASAPALRCPDATMAKK